MRMFSSVFWTLGRVVSGASVREAGWSPAFPRQSVAWPALHLGGFPQVGCKVSTFGYCLPFAARKGNDSANKSHVITPYPFHRLNYCSTRLSWRRVAYASNADC